MATRTVQLYTSDLTGEDIEKPEERVEVRVLDHPSVNRPVKLDAYALEVQSLLDAADEYVTLELVLPGDQIKNLVVPASKFASIFRGDVADALNAAEPYSSSRSAAGVRQPKRTSAVKRQGAPSMSREQRGAVRDWANNNGYTVGERGRIKSEIIAAFEAAH